MKEYMINKYLYVRSIKNGTDNNLVRKFHHLLTVGFLVVNNFVIEKYELWLNVEDEYNENSQSCMI